MTLTEKELRELDAWIAEHVMELKKSDTQVDCDSFKLSGNGDVWIRKEMLSPIQKFRPTTNPADAFEVLKRCAIRAEGSIHIAVIGDYFNIACRDTKPNDFMDPTLELAICLFAKKLFTK